MMPSFPAKHVIKYDTHKKAAWAAYKMRKQGKLVRLRHFTGMFTGAEFWTIEDLEAPVEQNMTETAT